MNKKKQISKNNNSPLPSGDFSLMSREARLAVKVKKFIVSNMVTILFVVLCGIGLRLSGLSMAFYFNDIINRIARNSFLVLALIIPVTAGMGLNFAIVLGAMAGQAAIIFVTHWGVGGPLGILLCAALSAPIAIFLGYLTGKLLNRARGKEMITSLILGFFANGVYQLIFLLMIGTVIPMKNDVLVLSSGVGLRTTIDLSNGLRYGLDDIIRTPFPLFVLWVAIAGMAGLAGIYLKIRKSPIADASGQRKLLMWIGFSAVIALWAAFIRFSGSSVNMVRVPTFTMLIITVLCLFNFFLVKTKLGQDLRSVGQDQHIAQVSGINVDRTRVQAIIISTLLAAWGHIIFLQNLGAFSTYGSHEQVGMFASAAILIGGASVSKANVGHAILGTILFHTLFIVSPLAGRNLLGDAQLGEYFRSFVAYGVIGVSLGLHAWRKLIQARKA